MTQAQSFNIMDEPQGLLQTPPAPAVSAVAAVASPKPATAVSVPKMRAFGDSRATRSAIYDRVLGALETAAPVTNQTHTLRLSGLSWADPDNYSKKRRKEAVLSGQTLSRRLRGTWELLDNATGNVVDKRQQTVVSVPHLTDSGTFIYNGSEYALRNQQRLRPGVFTRIKDNGEIEAHANILANGPSHRYFLDPEKGVFYMRIGQSKIPLLPLLQAMGASKEELREAWGNDLYATNYQKADASALTKLKERILKDKDIEEADGHVGNAITAAFSRMELDPDVTRKTLGQPYAGLDKDAIKAITSKLLAVSRGDAEVDDRDSLAYQTFLGPEDIFAERLLKDRAGVRRQLLFKMTGQQSLKRMPSSALQKQLDSAMLESGLGLPLEEINPAEILDKHTQITRLGEGGIPSLDQIPNEARAVQPSHLGYMDPVRTPESMRAGVDTHLTRNARKGEDGKLYTSFRDVRTGKTEWKTPQDLADSTVTFPGAMARGGKRVPAIKNGRMTYVRRNEVDYELPAFEDAFSPLGNMIPLKSMMKGQRAAMAGRMLTQALPLTAAEAPLVQSGMPGSGGTRSFEQEYAKHMGAVHAEYGGKVMAVDEDDMTVRYDDGRTEKIELYRNHPYNRKTFITQTPVIQPGERFKAGQLLSRSNYTNEKGTTALGLNARVAYVPWGGMNFEDALVISESMADRLTSEHLYQHDLDVSERLQTGKNRYVGLFPAKYDKKALANIDNDGVVKPGTSVNFGDPLILAAEEQSRVHGKVHRKRQAGHSDKTVTWQHHDPGVVTDVMKTKGGPRVLVRSAHPMQVGDKLSGRYGDKGVVSSIVPDARMPHGKDGKPFEVLMNPLGVISRTNPAQMVEASLGKLAAKLGHPIVVQDFEDVEDMTQWAVEQLRANGIEDLEDITDPENDTKIAGIKTGMRFIMKLHHTAEGKGQARSAGGYTSEDSPAKGSGPGGGSKIMALLDVNALLSHGATEVVRDAGAVRGQRNEDYWLQFMQGYTPREPKVPMVYEKFVNELKAAGINVVRDGTQTNIMAMTDKDVNTLAGNRHITSGDTVRDVDLEPIKGGLFDPTLTGGHHGRRWSAIPLNEPMPNPVMEEPVRRILGLTQKKFEAVLSGEENLPKYGTGPRAIASALDNINLDAQLAVTRSQVQYGTKTGRDAAVRKLGYLKSAKRLGIHPRDWMMKKVPVLPPQFRPISRMEATRGLLVSDPNYLYRDLIEANDNLKGLKKQVGDDVGNERLALYKAFKAVTGLGDPITQQSQDKEVRGILGTIFGSSPKWGTVQRKLISSTVDNVGRAVITPNPDLDMDSAGLPEDKAFEVYKRFVIRRLKRSGMPMSKALRETEDKTPLARKMLIEEMDSRPIVINRAPVLHRFGIMAFKPRLVTGDTLQISPLVVKGFGADFDGDAMQYHVPTTDESRKEALHRMLPSRQLLSPADFKTPVHAPSMEYVGGLYTASHVKSKRPVRTFASKADVIKARWRGEIGVTDRVKVLSS